MGSSTARTPGLKGLGTGANKEALRNASFLVYPFYLAPTGCRG
ncbi:hypothetical protein E2C01_100539 [Portunus trituberculatus]|uniref:Uncharacterized protein n=1 Tax=Portunus trituberculatus TaxID=210409 RepID=A0A5B7KHT9_PORTR|nr:hypothetical protein [Portunus trituberculatus]